MAGLDRLLRPIGRLVDAHHLVHMLDALQAVVLSRQCARVNQPLPKRLVEDFIDQRALASSPMRR